MACRRRGDAKPKAALLCVTSPIDSVNLGSQIAGKGLITASFFGLNPPIIKTSASILGSAATQVALSAIVNALPLPFWTDHNI